MSGYPKDTIARRGVLNSGMVFLQKPFSAESVLAKLGSMREAGIGL